MGTAKHNSILHIVKLKLVSMDYSAYNDSNFVNGMTLFFPYKFSERVECQLL